MKLFSKYSPKQRRNLLWVTFSVITVLLGVIITILFTSIFKLRTTLVLVSGVLLILLILLTYILGLLISHLQYRAEATKNDFTNNVVHEIKTPITVISLACEMLQDNEVMSKNDSQEQIKTYIPIIATETDRLKKMVDVFLQHSRIESSHFPLSFEQIDLHELIQKLTLRARILVERRNGKLNLELNAQNSMITGDVLQLTNVFTNIVDNAVKYSNGAPFITVKTESKLLGIVVRISDNGIGISEKELPHIFEKFYRVPTGDKHDVKGYGIGLNYALRIVHLHGGDIKVKSKEGEGSEFAIFLPYKQKTRSLSKASRHS